MTVRGALTVAGVECTKLAAQVKARVVLAVCVAGPFAFAAAMRLQSSLPEDTLFGRSVKESGFAVPLVVLGFAALWGIPALTSVVGGDLFASEDRFGTWTTLLTRSRSRGDVFAGKLFAALGFSLLALTVLAASSVAAGMLAIGRQPLIDLSGLLRSPADAGVGVGLAWISVLPPAFAFTALAVLASVATRSSVAGVALPVVAGLALQMATLMDGPEATRRLLITSAFGAWHGVLTEPPFYSPIVYGTLVSAGYFATCVIVAYRILQRRDIGA